MVGFTLNLRNALLGEVCLRLCPIDRPLLDWKLETEIRKKGFLNYILDFGIRISCANWLESCPRKSLSMTEEYERFLLML